MKAPEKIYVEVCEDGIFAFEKPPFEESIEYVRKDALIEWLNELKHIYVSPVSPPEKSGRFLLQKAKTLQVVIDKLNSM